MGVSANREGMCLEFAPCSVFFEPADSAAPRVILLKAHCFTQQQIDCLYHALLHQQTIHSPFYMSGQTACTRDSWRHKTLGEGRDPRRQKKKPLQLENQGLQTFFTMGDFVSVFIPN